MIASRSMSDETHTGGCQCGAVRYQITGPLQGGHVCHCRMCQRATGGLFAALVGQKQANIVWTKGALSLFRSSSIATRGFCERCGTPLTFAYDRAHARLYVTIGSLDRPEDVVLERQFGVESRLPWVSFCEQVPDEVTGEADPDFFASMVDLQGKPD
jgi:hypothetical protein